MTTLAATDYDRNMEDWEWADGLFQSSDFVDTFEVDDCSYDETTGNHIYFDEAGNQLIVTPHGDVIPGNQE